MIGNTTKGKSFGGTVKYVLGKKDAQLIYTNVFAGLGSEISTEAIAAEMAETARRNRTTQPVYHLSVSPAESDRLSIPDWVNFSQDLVRELGLVKHQVVVALHNDEDYPSGQPRPHAHFVINLVDDAGKRANTSWDYYKTELALRHLEKCYELTALQFSWECQHRPALSGQLEQGKPAQLVSKSLSHTTVAEAEQMVLPAVSATPQRQTQKKQLSDASEGSLKKVLGVSETQTEHSEQEIAMTQAEIDKQPQSSDKEHSYKRFGDIAAAAIQQNTQQYTDNSSSRPGRIAGNELERFGQFLQSYGDQEVDGTQLAGAGLSLLGNGVKIADAIASAIARAREQADQERLNKIIDGLEAVGERTQNLEENIKVNVLREQQTQEPLEALSDFSTAPKSTVEALVNPVRVNQVIDNLEAVGERTQELEARFSNYLEPSSLASDPSGSKANLSSLSISESENKEQAEVNAPVSESEIIPDFWAEVDSEVEQPDLAAIANKLQNAADLKELQQIKEEYGKQATTAAWNTLPHLERDRLTELAQPQEATVTAPSSEARLGKQPETSISETENREQSEPPGAFSETENATEKVASDVSSENPLASATELLSQQINRLEEQIVGNSDSEFVPITIDRQASFSKQLDQIEAAIAQLNERLDKLEEVVKSFQEQRERSSEAADTLVEHAKARAEIYGTNPEEPIPTKSGGTIEVSNQDNYVAIRDKNDEIQFEAVKLNGTWEVTANDLSEEDIKRLISLPKDPDAYRTHINGRDLMKYLQENVPDQFLPNQQGTILWQNKEDEFSYKFTIDGSAEAYQVKGIDKSNQAEIFSATIQADGTVRTSKSEIPTERIDDLVMREQRQEQQQERQKAATKSQQEELTQ